jgi:hypothetical protein
LISKNEESIALTKGIREEVFAQFKSKKEVKEAKTLFAEFEKAYGDFEVAKIVTLLNDDYFKTWADFPK